ncbi:MAG TPA: hypothetical protein VMW45_04200 [Dehalococcoidia bacterium]|nr:hypothetical protein [Dehalococcoidia bacterium]
MAGKPEYQKDIEELLKKMEGDRIPVSATDALQRLIEATVAEAEKLAEELMPFMDSIEGLTTEDKLALLPLLRKIWGGEDGTPTQFFRVFNVGRAFERRKIK